MALFPQTKSSRIFWAVGLLAVGFFLFVIGYGYYDQWQGERQVEKMAEALKQAEQEIFNRKASDKIGGKTPQETLDLFIKAVEDGDYELASKYFVVEKQEEARKELTSLKEKNNLNWYLDILKKAKPDGEIKNNNFRMISKLEIGPPDYLIDFIKYPSGNWKIEEI